MDKAQAQILGIDEVGHLSPEVVTEQRPDCVVQLAKAILAALKRSPLGVGPAPREVRCELSRTAQVRDIEGDRDLV